MKTKSVVETEGHGAHEKEQTASSLVSVDAVDAVAKVASSMLAIDPIQGNASIKGVRKDAPMSYILIVSGAFCLLYGVYFGVQNLVTSVLGTNGYLLMATVNGTFLLTSFLTPIVVAYVPRNTLFVAAAGCSFFLSFFDCSFAFDTHPTNTKHARTH